MTIGVVHIVEWLNAGDATTGQSLFNELESMGIASNPPVAVDFHRIDTRGELDCSCRGSRASISKPAGRQFFTSRTTWRRRRTWNGGGSIGLN